MSRLPENIHTAVTVGTFDGIHKGHIEILQELLDESRSRDLRSVLVTFEPHPRHIIQPGDKIKLLTGTRIKIRLLSELGLDYIVVLPFDQPLAELTPDRFVTDYLLSRYNMRTLVVGYDHAFGRDRTGGDELLAELSAAKGFKLVKVPPVIIDGRPVSSSRVRDALDEGDMGLAARLLGRFYSFAGRVVTGSGRGKRLGHPTANLEPLIPHKQLFPDGIYACFTDLDGRLISGVLHHGPRPTFDDRNRTLELHLYGFESDLYGRRLEVSVIEHIRPIMRFSSAEELQKQMEKDDKEAKAIFSRIKIPAVTLSSRIV